MTPVLAHVSKLTERRRFSLKTWKSITASAVAPSTQRDDPSFIVELCKFAAEGFVHFSVVGGAKDWGRSGKLARISGKLRLSRLLRSSRCCAL